MNDFWELLKPYVFTSLSYKGIDFELCPVVENQKIKKYTLCKVLKKYKNERNVQCYDMEEITECKTKDEAINFIKENF